jgi:hypothetical protein
MKRHLQIVVISMVARGPSFATTLLILHRVEGRLSRPPSRSVLKLCRLFMPSQIQPDCQSASCANAERCHDYCISIERFFFERTKTTNYKAATAAVQSNINALEQRIDGASSRASPNCRSVVAWSFRVSKRLLGAVLDSNS